MSPADIIEGAANDGVLLALSPNGRISAKGDQSAVDRWLPTVRERKAAIVAELQRDRRRAKVLAMLRDNPGIRYAIEVADAHSDPVIVSVGIRRVATFEMRIPLVHYDAYTLMELIERHAGDEYAHG